MIIPFLEFAGSNCQDAVILVEEEAVRLKPLGGFEGAVIRRYMYVGIIIIIISKSYLLHHEDIISSSPFLHRWAEIFSGCLIMQICWEKLAFCTWFTQFNSGTLSKFTIQNKLI